MVPKEVPSNEISQLVIAEPPLEAILKVIVAGLGMPPVSLHEIEPPILELEGAAALAAGIL